MAVRKDVIISVKFTTPRIRSFSQALKIPQEQFNKLSDGVGNFNKGVRENATRMGRAGLAVRKATTGFRGFKMELLGVMFFGMAVQKLFKSLIQPALQMTGAMELFSNVLGIIFLPLGLMMIDWAIALLDWWNNLSDSTQALIQRFVLIGIAVGLFLQTFGALGLGLGSLIISFGGLIALFINALPIILAIAAVMALFGLSIPFVSASTDDLNSNLEKQEGFFSRLIGTVDRLWESFIDFGPISKFLKNMGLTEAKIENLKNPIKTLKDFFTDLWDKIKETEAFTSIEEGIDEMRDKWESFKEDWVNNIWPQIKEPLDTMLSILNLIGILITSFGIGGRVLLRQEDLWGRPIDVDRFGNIGGDTINLSVSNNIVASSDVDLTGLEDRISASIIEALERLKRT